MLDSFNSAKILAILPPELLPRIIVLDFMLIRQLKLPGLFLVVKKEVVFILITKEREDCSSLGRCQTET